MPAVGALRRSSSQSVHVATGVCALAPAIQDRAAGTEALALTGKCLAAPHETALPLHELARPLPASLVGDIPGRDAAHGDQLGAGDSPCLACAAGRIPGAKLITVGR